MQVVQFGGLLGLARGVAFWELLGGDFARDGEHEGRVLFCGVQERGPCACWYGEVQALWVRGVA